MRPLYGLHAKAVMLLATVGALLAHPAHAVTPCTDLPSSVLFVYSARASAVEVMEVRMKDLPSDRQAGDLASQHSMMLSESDFVTAFEITHRAVPQIEGSFCDAPSLVRIGFGSTYRVAFLASEAAADPCVRHEMLEHEDAHTRLLNDVVDRFIERQRSNLQRGMAALKQTPAGSAEIAKARWEAGLRAIVAESKRQLLDAIRSASAKLDEAPALSTLENACGGKIRQLLLGGTP